MTQRSGDRLLDPDEVAALERAVSEALEAGGSGGLEILGYGEINAVVAWQGRRGRVAAKRLPEFATRAQFRDYEAVLHDYLSTLRRAGIEVVRTELAALDRDRRVAAWCVQEALDPRLMAPAVLARSSSAGADAFDEICRRIVAAVDGRTGLDGQLSNWAVIPDGTIRYVDVSTPLLRDEMGRERLDADVFLASLPWILRGFVRRFMVGGIVAKYYERRSVVLDLLANLFKEGLGTRVPALLDLANRHVSQPISQREVRRYYAKDARMWALLQRLRAADRGWQRRVRRRDYPFLLPGKIERHR